ncbi:glycosyltransferase family 2 protein [Yersinia alsatica]|uniref:glycosyltransferase family 2 protein n=1 Tax=Yersinia alsatica TaxID=2890317 RepID=UPI00119F65FA|nr:glycosyltransferase family 2 protein [Yersinia alsatica]
MGAVNFSIDPMLVNTLKSSLPLDIFVETGTFKGDTIELIRDKFSEIYSVELSNEYYEMAVQRFADYANINLVHSNSPSAMQNWMPGLINKSVLYFLDAHWCAAENTASIASQCPLLDEINAIGKLNAESVIVIDDARLFLAPPLIPHEISQWPSFHQIISALLSMSSNHELMVVNDVIVFHPKYAKAVMQSYAQINGIDWLIAAQNIHNEWMEEAKEKENVIQDLKQSLSEKDIIIESQYKEIIAYRTAYGGLGLLRPFARLIHRLYEIVRPRLGNLNQYAPREVYLGRWETNKVFNSYPSISIVTPSYNQARFIERTIVSILEQQYPNIEYYVQDGGSTDRTVEILKQYQANLTGWVSEPDSGQSQAINRGLAKTNGEIMAWLNSDDLLLPGALHTVADYFIRHPDIDVVYGNRLLIDECDKEIGRWILPGHDNEVLSWTDYVPQETLFWRRSIWEKAGGQIDESFRFAMDWDLLVRFRDVGARFGHVDQFLGAFRIHASQKTSAEINEVGHQEMDRIRMRILGSVPDQKAIRRAIFPYMIKHIVADMNYRIKTRLGIKT